MKRIPSNKNSEKMVFWLYFFLYKKIRKNWYSDKAKSEKTSILVICDSNKPFPESMVGIIILGYIFLGKYF